MQFKEQADQIIELKKKDLELRNKLIQSGELFTGYNAEMAKLHGENADVLDSIMDLIGYPTFDKVGKEASDAAWLVIQHAIERPDFMRKCAKHLEAAVQENNASPVNLAYLTDRIAVFEGKPQIFGTQFDWDENGEMSPMPFKDLDLVNKRRKSIGLNTLEAQTIVIKEQAKKENETPPKDFLKRKNEMDQWRKKVGWKQ